MLFTSTHSVVRFLSIVFIFLWVSISGYSQTRTRQTVSIGPRLGVNVANFRGDVENNRAVAGIAVGGILTYSVVSHFGISLEALYSQKGTRYDAGNVKFTSRINYVEVPVYGRYFLNTEGGFRPNVFLGPAFGFKLNARDFNADNTIDRNVTEDYNAVDVGITAGIGLNFLVASRQRVLIDARYNLGLADIAATADRQVYNSTFTLTAGLSFGIGKRYER